MKKLFCKNITVIMLALLVTIIGVLPAAANTVDKTPSANMEALKGEKGTNTTKDPVKKPDSSSTGKTDAAKKTTPAIEEQLIFYIDFLENTKKDSVSYKTLIDTNDNQLVAHLVNGVKYNRMSGTNSKNASFDHDGDSPIAQKEITQLLQRLVGKDKQLNTNNFKAISSQSDIIKYYKYDGAKQQFYVDAVLFSTPQFLVVYDYNATKETITGTAMTDIILAPVETTSTRNGFASDTILAFSKSAEYATANKAKLKFAGYDFKFTVLSDGSLRLDYLRAASK